MRISDWSSDVCSSDLRLGRQHRIERPLQRVRLDFHIVHAFHSFHESTAITRAAGCIGCATRLTSARSSASSSRGRIPRAARTRDRKSVGQGKSVSVRVDLGGRRIIKKKKQNKLEKSHKQVEQYKYKT